MARSRVSQAQLGQALGLTQQAISRRLNGVVAFDVDELAVTADLLSVPIASLITAPTPTRTAS